MSTVGDSERNIDEDERKRAWIKATLRGFDVKLVNKLPKTSYNPPLTYQSLTGTASIC